MKTVMKMRKVTNLCKGDEVNADFKQSREMRQ